MFLINVIDIDTKGQELTALFPKSRPLTLSTLKVLLGYTEPRSLGSTTICHTEHSTCFPFALKFQENDCIFFQNNKISFLNYFKLMFVNQSFEFLLGTSSCLSRMW